MQGAAHAGAEAVIAVDPVPFKRESAMKLGATHAVDSIQEATQIGRELTNGQGVDSAIVAVGVTTGAHIGQGLRAVRKAGTCVVVGVGETRSHDGDIPIRVRCSVPLPPRPTFPPSCASTHPGGSSSTS